MSAVHERARAALIELKAACDEMDQGELARNMPAPTVGQCLRHHFAMAERLIDVHALMEERNL